MKRLGLVLPLAAALVTMLAPPLTLADTSKDALCPRAVPKLIAFDEAAATGDKVKIAAAAQGAAAAYELCAVDAHVTVPVEPTMNYDKTRRAQFLVVLGRVQAVEATPAAAIATLRVARSLADEVATWLPTAASYVTSNRPSGTSTDRNSDRNGSRYKDAAAQIRAAADDELAKLGATPAPAASPSPRS